MINITENCTGIKIGNLVVLSCMCYNLVISQTAFIPEVFNSDRGKIALSELK